MSKLRTDQFVNRDDNGSPNFPHSAVVPDPTDNNHFANKLYSDVSMSLGSSSTNTISKQPPQSPSPGDFWTDISRYWTATSGNNIISLNIWTGSSWVNVRNTQEFPTGQIISPPSITGANGVGIYNMITATSAVVSDAYYVSSKWYKNDVEIPGATGFQYYATEDATYKYEEIWVNAFEDEVLPTTNIVISDALVITTPTVLTPPDGEGVGSYTPKTDVITNVSGQGSSSNTITLSSANTYDASNNTLISDISTAFTNGLSVDKGSVSSSSGNTMVVDTTYEQWQQSTVTIGPKLGGAYTGFLGAAYDESSNRLLAVADDGNGIYKSDDGGLNWTYLAAQPSSAGSGGNKFSAITYSPVHDMWACPAGENGIYTSTDGGVSWTQRSVPGTPNLRPYGIKFVATSYNSSGIANDGVWYAWGNRFPQGGNTIVKSTNGTSWSFFGASWSVNDVSYHIAANKMIFATYDGFHYGTGTSGAGDYDFTFMSTNYGGGADAHHSYQLDYERANDRMISTSPGRRQIMYTSDGINWSRTPERNNNNSPWYAFFVSSSGEYFLWGPNGYIYTSNDLTQDLNDWEQWDKPSSSLINQDGTKWFETPLGFIMVGKYDPANPTARVLYSSTGKQGWNSYSVGERVVSEQPISLPGPDVSSIALTASAPTTSAGVPASWDAAEWHLATDSTFSQNLQSWTGLLNSDGTHRSAPSFGYSTATTYYVRFRYYATKQSGSQVISDWSPTSSFRTSS